LGIAIRLEKTDVVCMVLFVRIDRCLEEEKMRRRDWMWTDELMMMMMMMMMMMRRNRKLCRDSLSSYISAWSSYPMITAHACGFHMVASHDGQCLKAQVGLSWVMTRCSRFGRQHKA
jgi:ADP-ribosylglycohydrolase